MPENQTAPTQEEYMVGQWKEPAAPARFQTAHLFRFLIGPALLITAGLIGLGYWQKETTFYLAAAVTVMATLAVLSQQRHPSRQLEISLTNRRVYTPHKSYWLEEIAGFWLEKEEEYSVINLEPKKGAFLPVTFLYPSSDLPAVKNFLLQVMPEVEPRNKSFADSINSYFRW